MNKIDFGWVIQPAPRGNLDAAGLVEANHQFIQALRGKFSTIWVEDHFQWEGRPTLECWTTLTYLAALYPEFHFGTLVLGQSYRNPAHTAKMAAVLQLLTGGRLILGLGAGWKEDEYRAYGWQYPEARVRIEQLEETAEIIRRMWAQSPATFKGKHYSIREAHCEPRPNPAPPLMIGGGGEKFTLRVVARHADWWNANFLTPEELKRKLDALRGHCRVEGRDFASIKITYFGFVNLTDQPSGRTDLHVIESTPEAVLRELQAHAALGVTHFILRFTDFPSLAGLEAFVEQVLPHFNP